jgi:E3 ubiquitin-protein ligase RNF181
MTSYFDEHDCVPLADNERPNEQLLLARLLIDSGISDFLNMRSSGQQLAPPVSKKWLEKDFPTYCFNQSEMVGYKCPVCIKEFEKIENSEERDAIKLPKCGHTFHCSCMKQWLEVTNSCPLCRDELPTDDPNYEQMKINKEREKVREAEIAELHNSMYG